MTLKIATWNVNYENAKVAEACAFVKDLLIKDAYDVVCMQEVPAMLAERLEEESSLTVTKGIDAMLQRDETPFPIYHLIVSKVPPVSSTAYRGVTIPDIHEGNPFSLPLRMVGMWVHPALTRGFLSADFRIDGQDVRIFSVHPPLSSPQDRADELALIVKELSPDMPNIVCGDFNILETYPVKLLNWFLRLHFLQAMPWYPERERMEARFARAGLKNPHAGMHLKTQREARSQLDHILIPTIATMTEGTALTESRRGFIGSDHYPVIAAISL